MSQQYPNVSQSAGVQRFRSGLVRVEGYFEMEGKFNDPSAGQISANLSGHHPFCENRRRAPGLHILAVATPSCGKLLESVQMSIFDSV